MEKPLTDKVDKVEKAEKAEKGKDRKLGISTLDPDVHAAVDAAFDKKAEDILVLDLRGLATFTDYFLICSGGSQRQLETIADNVEERLRGEGRKPSHVEGYPKGEWILMDYVDFVVHIFTPQSRAYYDLERLWGDARRLDVGDEWRSSVLVKSKARR